jgi:hypothetical protein
MVNGARFRGPRQAGVTLRDAALAQRLLQPQRCKSKGARAMKISTLLTMVTLSASCFAAPVHTAYESTASGRNQSPTQATLKAEEAPVAPAAPDVAVMNDRRTQRWEFIALPKSKHLDRGFVARDEHLQT